MGYFSFVCSGVSKSHRLQFNCDQFNLITKLDDSVNISDSFTSSELWRLLFILPDIK